MLRLMMLLKIVGIAVSTLGTGTHDSWLSTCLGKPSAACSAAVQFNACKNVGRMLRKAVQTAHKMKHGTGRQTIISEAAT